LGERKKRAEALWRQSASASLDSGCRDDPYHPPSCRPSIVTVTVPDYLALFPSPSFLLFLSVPLPRFLCLAIDPYLVLRCRRRRPSPPRERDGPLLAEGSSIVLSLSLFLDSFRSPCGKDLLRFSACVLRRCNCYVKCRWFFGFARAASRQVPDLSLSVYISNVS